MKLNNKIMMILAVILAAGIIASVLIAVSVKRKNDPNRWKEQGYDLSLPVLNKDGWYMVFEDDFNGTKLNEGIKFGEKYTGNKEIWTTSPHAVRWQSDDESKPEQGCWWCPEMVEVKDSKAIIHSRYEENHTCDGDCPSKGRFTSGIETRLISGDKNNNKGTSDTLLFAQAFGYFECRVKFPKSQGLWSAFWLQSSNMRQVGNKGKDGTEIDIYESAFLNNETSRMGHALLWDGYGKRAKVADYIGNLLQDLYDGFHTFALKWTPEYYVFYIDGVATWASEAGDVSRVKEFLRLTVEIDAGDGFGPHGQEIGLFSHNNSENDDFEIDYVKVWQNENYEKYIKDDSEFKGSFDLA